ncbi:MAG: DUF262 domain-containing protein [Chloroflexi bacterium]|nr:DUF262 domain-containing protein [Chloroflexota bacterium]
MHTLVDQWNSEILVLPEIQREYVWDDARASRLIESLLLNIPIPVVYFAETPDAKYEVIDGHQRIRSIVRFLKNQFRLRSLAVLTEYNGKHYFELPEREQRFLTMRSIRAVIIGSDSHPNMKFEIFGAPEYRIHCPERSRVKELPLSRNIEPAFASTSRGL